MTEDDLVEVQSVHGPMLAFKDDFITKQIVRFGAHTRTEIAFLVSVVEPGDAVFDLGAHIGTYAIPLARKTGSEGMLLAVEATQRTFSVLERNLSGAGLRAKITALNALIARPGQSYKALTPEGNTGGTYYVMATEDADPVAVVTLDELCRRYFVPRVIKIDIEGGELSAFAESSVLQRVRPIVYAEINRKKLELQGASNDEMEMLFRGAGYRLFQNIGERQATHDNFVAVELDDLPTNKNNFDVLAIHSEDPRLDAFLSAEAL
jgi:FkbM family methyltransferase